MLNRKIRSLRRKQMLIIMLISSIVLLLACSAFVAFDAVNFRGELAKSVTVLAEAIGNNCAAAIDFNDPKSAADTLAALHANDNIVAACVYTPDGRVFAVYQRNPAASFSPPAMQTPAAVFTGNELHLFRAIRQRGELTGAIFVASDLKALSARLSRYVGIAGVVLAASLLLALALSSRLQRLVSDPILHLAGVARSVALEKNYSVRAAKQSDDELGQLVDGFNEMLAQIQARDTALQSARDELEKRVEERTGELENIHKQLVEASRRGGMAEIATNVLHNVGNVLNSVNISAGLMMEIVKQSRAANLGRVVALLRKNERNLGEFITIDPQGRTLPAYLEQMSGHVTADQSAILKELESLRSNIEHIKEIVAMQQSYATFGGLKEVVNVVDLVEDSLRMNEGALKRHQVGVTREFEPVPVVNVEKHKILQILVNLLRNAKYACQESGRPDKHLTVRVARSPGWLNICVRDNGVGIAPENLTRIFNHGFTTRKDGHGFGLHSGALAAREMGGSLKVFSAGSGQGAAFTLELPCPEMEAAHA